MLSYALTTVARVKTFLSIGIATDDALLSILIDSCTEYIEKYCDRRFKQTTYTNDVYDGNGSNVLYTKQYPISSITSVQERGAIENTNSWQTISSTHYFFDANQGKIIRTDAVFSVIPQHYRVSYVAGYNFDNAATYLTDADAGDLEMACWKLVAKVYYDRKNSANIRSESIGDYSVTFARETFADKELLDLLHTYKRDFVG